MRLASTTYMTPTTASTGPSPNAAPNSQNALRAATAPHQRALVLLRFGGPEGFELVERPMPSAGEGEVRIRVLAASVQFTDLLLRKGKYPDLKEKPPLVLGYDVVGEVDEVGPGVTDLRIGDRVADLTMTGSYARYRTLRADRAVRVPLHVDPAEATALVLTWATAYQLLHRAALVKAGERVLVIGAAGAVGQALLTLGRLAGLEMWGTARPAHLELVRSLGATPVDMNADNGRGLAPHNFDAVLDGVGDQGFLRSWAYVRKGGRLIGFGFTSPVLTGASMLRVGYWLLRLHLWDWLPNGKAARFYSITALRKSHPDWYRVDLETLFDLLSRGAVRPRIAERIQLEGVADAHRRIEAGGLDGKIVLCP
jgi:NADPH:quinone reductase-like Zn-dependent oxidoreductase